MSNRFHDKLGGACTAILAVGIAGAATADVPAVATDIAPVHGLVSQVMEGLGAPSLIVRRGATPHEYALRPSEAQAVEDAQAVFWVGPELEPWLEDSIETLAPDAMTVALLDLPQTETLAFRQGATFAAHSHDHADHGHDDHAGHDHADHDDHASHAGHDDHAHEGHDHAAHAEGDHGHAHDGIDPHAWLDPRNAMAWLDVIADRLGEIDPDNAETYARNAEAGKAEIETAVAEIDDMLAPMRDTRFVVFHDAYQYFETRFDVPAAGAIALSDASAPSPARIEEVRDTVAQLDVSCVFAEPQFDDGIVATVLDGTDGHAATLDPLGSEIALGPDFYTAFLRELGSTMADCAG